MHFTMKIFKQALMIVALILAFTFIANPPSALAGNGSLNNFENIDTYKNGQFKDVSSGDWFSKNVKTAYEMDLMKGQSNSYFNANGKITLVEVITIAARIHSIYYTGDDNFPKGNTWYEPYVDYALEHGIISSKPSNLNNVVTRSQFAKILSQALPDEALAEINNVESGSIPDVSNGASYKNAVYQLYRAGILAGGTKDGDFYPSKTITRAEVAAICTRMADSSLRVDVTLSAPSQPEPAPEPELTTEEEFAAEVLRLVNIEREKEGLNSLKMSSKNTEAALIRASEIQTKFSHTRPDGSSCFTALASCGVDYWYAGENIAIGQRTPEQVVAEWMASPGHKANILKPNYNELGVGVIKNGSGEYAGYAWVQMFTD